MQKIDVTDSVLNIISDQFGVPKVSNLLEQEFEADMGGDSLDAVELLMEFEDEFEITIEDEDALKWKTPLNAIDFICEKLQVTS